MEFNEKRRIINEMCDQLKKSMIDDLPKTPVEWDGLELHAWLVWRVKEQFDPLRLDKQRMDDFVNYCVCSNL